MDNALLIEKARGGDKEALSALIEANMGLVKSIALRFRDRGTELEDLTQIGVIGMIKAIRNFDFSYETKFSTYAVPLIIGEIKKFLRDDGLIKVGRETKRRGIVLSKEREKFFSINGREPRIDELSALAGISEEDVLSALEASSCVISFSETVGDDDTTIESFLGTDNTAAVCESIALRQALASLAADEREIIYNRYFRGYSQSKVADICGITQVKVSRTEKKIIEKLRKELVV